MTFDAISDWMDKDFILGYVLPVLAVLIFSVIVDRVAKKYAKPAVKKWIKRTETTIDDLLLERVINARLIHILPFLVIYAFAFVFQDAADIILRLSVTIISFIILLTIGALLDTFNEIYETQKMTNKLPIKSHLQIIKIFFYVVGIVTILAQLTGQSPWFFITGVGVFTAIILLIFKDTILSFVASLQIASNDLFREGDWIEVPSYGADGDVIDISLHAVRVQNWDKTITVIPTYKFLEVSFKNWRGMQESGGRRIKRSINIDISSIRLCDEKMLARFRKISLLKNYMDQKERVIDEYNREHNVNLEELVDGRRLTNIGTFRAYIGAYLDHNGNIHPELTFLIRQLEPGPHGLPIQVYVFTSDTNWVNYEAIQADIFDHLLAVVPEFELRVFQNPTGSDFQSFQRDVGNS